jgi:eukaryotic-like serine/threonine-protein kinase
MEPSRSDPQNEIERPANTPFELITLRQHGPESSPAGAPSLSYAPGRLIADKYRLLRLLGQGGMCTVWAVQNVVLDAQFALKLIRNDGGEEHAAERMLREARAAARIEHPAIIRVFDFGTTPEGDPFLVMELLSGVSVRDRLRDEGTFAPVEAVRLLLPIAEALAVAHSHGVVHRDLKPDNIVLVEQEGGKVQPKLIDFGIAKQIEEERITQTGMVLGSPEYMSPEQALGLVDVDQRTDIWSFSIALFEMLTGTTPFLRHGELATILQAVVEQPLPPMSKFGVHEPELWTIISRGLRKAPEDRWEDMHALGVALASWLVEHGVDEDVCMQSVRRAWLAHVPSVSPMAIDVPSEAMPSFPPPSAGRPGFPAPSTRKPKFLPPGAPKYGPLNTPQSRLDAFSEAYEIPKKSMWRTMLGVAAAAGTIAIIGAGALYASLSKQAPPRATPDKVVTPRAAPNEPLPPPPPPETTEPAGAAPAPPAEAASGDAKSKAAPPSDDAKRKEATSDEAKTKESSAPSKSAKRRARRAPQPTFAPAPPPFTAEPSPSRTQPSTPLAAPLAPEPLFGGTTELPHVKPPPDFGSAPPSKKPETNSAGGASDNPYDDEK